MNKNNLLSIGEISGITGVHINSLRYYEKIGILKPAYIDPFTKYRYYSSSQIGIIEAIQACIEMDIPLKQYLDFTENNGQTIHVEQLLEYGKKQAYKKRQAINNGIKHIEFMQKEIEHSKMLQNSAEPVIYEVPAKKYFVVPMEKPMLDSEYISLDRLHIIATAKGYTVGQELGLMYVFGKNMINRYQFIEIVSGAKKSDKNIITVPATLFIAKIVTEDRIENAENEFPQQFLQCKDRIVIETELFTGNVDVDKPLYELRCTLNNNSQ